MSIIGIAAGSSGLFFATKVPLDGVLQSGPVFSTADAGITLKPTNDPSATIVGVTAGTTATSFRLTVTGKSSSGEISNSFAIPILK